MPEVDEHEEWLAADLAKRLSFCVDIRSDADRQEGQPRVWIEYRLYDGYGDTVVDALVSLIHNLHDAVSEAKMGDDW